MKGMQKSFSYKNDIYFGIYCILLLFLGGKEIALLQGTYANDTPQMYLSVSAGGYHTCAIASDRRLYCWGRNTYGQLGIGNTSDSQVPVLVDGENTYRQVSAGGEHTCAIRTDGTLYCWGCNHLGKLGLGDTTDRHTPTLVDKGKKYRHISLSSQHSCGIRLDGKLYCWGANDAGQLGVGDTRERNIPTMVDTYTYKQVSVGEKNTCAIRNDGKLYCWGDNEVGQIGIGKAGGSVTRPRGVDTKNTYSVVSVGNAYVCGIRTNKKLYCWGKNEFGQLGFRSKSNQSSQNSLNDGMGTIYYGEKTTPQGVDVKNDYKVVVTGQDHTCAIRENGIVYCWGCNEYGQVGNSKQKTIFTPRAVDGRQQYQSISAGLFHTCGIRKDGSLHCWGYNEYGQLGGNE